MPSGLATAIKALEPARRPRPALRGTGYCRTCRFWAALPEPPAGWAPGTQAGQCRRYPPTLLTIDAGPGAVTIAWPITAEQQWCGEHALGGWGHDPRFREEPTP